MPNEWCTPIPFLGTKETYKKAFEPQTLGYSSKAKTRKLFV